MFFGLNPKIISCLAYTGFKKVVNQIKLHGNVLLLHILLDFWEGNKHDKLSTVKPLISEPQWFKVFLLYRNEILTNFAQLLGS